MADLKLLQEAVRYGQFSEHFNQPLAQPLRVAVKQLIEEAASRADLLAGKWDWSKVAEASSAAPAGQEDARDAARYRWLCLMAWGVPREHGWHELTFRSFGVARWMGATKEVADAAIDGAMSATTKEN